MLLWDGFQGFYVICFAKIFLLLYFITHIKWDAIIFSSLRLLLKMWIWYRWSNRIENYYHHIGEQLAFYKKMHISKHRGGCSCNICIARNCTQENVRCHIQHEEKWLRWIVMEQVNYYFPLIYPERNCARTLSKPLRKK